MEIEKISDKLSKIEAELKKNILTYKKSTGEEKLKWKKEAARNLKKKKFYEEYLHNLENKQYEKEMKVIQHDMDVAKKEFVREINNKSFLKIFYFLPGQNVKRILF